MKTRTLLEEARDLIEEPSAWIKGYRALDENGSSTDATGADAIQFCAEGAMLHACRDVLTRVNGGVPASTRRISKSLRYRVCLNVLDSVVDCDISIYNDHPATTHEDILRVFDRAIAKAWE